MHSDWSRPENRTRTSFAMCKFCRVPTTFRPAFLGGARKINCFRVALLRARPYSRSRKSSRNKPQNVNESPPMASIIQILPIRSNSGVYFNTDVADARPLSRKSRQPDRHHPHQPVPVEGMRHLRESRSLLASRRIPAASAPGAASAPSTRARKFRDRFQIRRPKCASDGRATEPVTFNQELTN